MPPTNAPWSSSSPSSAAQKESRPPRGHWPDWRRNPPSAVGGEPPSTYDQLAVLWTTAALPCLILFVSFISLEWYLQRWELV